MAFVYSDINMYQNVYNMDELVFDEYSINQSIMTILGTIQGQRLFRPTFGSNIYNLLFEPMCQNTANALRASTIGAIGQWETRINITNSIVYPDIPNRVYYVQLDYTIPSLQGRAATFSFNLTQLPRLENMTASTQVTITVTAPGYSTEVVTTATPAIINVSAPGEQPKVTIPSQPVPLSMVSVDFNTLLGELVADLQNRNTWNDLLLSGTGTTLLDYISSVGIFNQYNIEMAFREAFLNTALRDSSVYGISRMLGISVGRKLPSVVAVNLTNKSSAVLTIGALQSFVGQMPMVNITPISIGPGQTSQQYMKIGNTGQITFAASNSIYTEYLLGQPGFIVSGDQADMQVITQDNVSGVQTVWTYTEDALWMYGPNDQVYWASTIDTGDVSIIFGDGVYGQMPPVTSTIIVNYLVTNGTASNISLTGTTATYSGNRFLAGPITSYFAAGVDEKPALYYKLYAPHMYKARGRCITKTDYISIIMGNNDVADVIVQAQRDLYPNNPMWNEYYINMRVGDRVKR